MRIHKYPVVPGYYEKMPVVKVIHFGHDPNHNLCIWGEHDPDSADKWEIVVLGTGEIVPDDKEHLFSCVGNLYVWHLYGRKL